MTHHLKLANSDAPSRQIGDYAQTETAINIRRSLDLVESIKGGALTIVSGAPGIGKTAALKAFKAETDAIYVQVAKGEGTPRNFAYVFFLAFMGGRPAFTSISEARSLIECYMDKRTLIVDEAQYLDQRTRGNPQKGEVFEWLRAASEHGGFNLVFAGDRSLADIIGRFPQLQSRMVRPVVIDSVSIADVTAILEGTPFTGREAVYALHAIGRLPGGLRNVENVLRMATAFAGADVPNTAHLKAAILDMNLAPRGVRK
tara:strand:+ start:94 stop:867 length:774 start_codon:yes stop_codon:yes gene_type:complete